jgi:hypothetical protein
MITGRNLYRQYEKRWVRLPQVVFSVFRQLQADGFERRSGCSMFCPKVNVGTRPLVGSRIPRFGAQLLRLS